MKVTYLFLCRSKRGQTYLLEVGGLVSRLAPASNVPFWFFHAFNDQSCPYGTSPLGGGTRSTLSLFIHLAKQIAKRKLASLNVQTFLMAKTNMAGVNIYARCSYIIVTRLKQLPPGDPMGLLWHYQQTH